MDLMGVDIGQIVHLGTHVATTGAIRTFEMVEDDLFEFIIGIAVLIHAIDPG